MCALASHFLQFIFLILPTKNYIKVAPMAKTSSKKKNIFNRSEPSTRHFFTEYADYGLKYEQCGWLIFCQNLHGYDANVTLAFSQGFDNQTVKIGNINFEIIEDSIASVIGIPQTSERWFKNNPIRAINYNVFLVDKHQNPNWSKGILRAWV